MIDPEAEAAAIRVRSAELAALLDAGIPVVDLGPVRAAQAEAARLGAVAQAARKDVAVRLAAGMDAGAGVVVGRSRPIRRVRTDARGRDLDGVLKGRAAITPQLIRCIEFRRDVVGPTIADAYRRAIEARPWRPALVAAVRGHIGLVGLRQNSDSEGGPALAAALETYERSYAVLREAIIDGEHVAVEAADRLANLEREKAEALVGDDDTVITGLIASAVAGATPDQVVIDGRPIGMAAPAEPRPQPVSARR